MTTRGRQVKPIITMDQTSNELWLTHLEQPAKPVLLGYVEGIMFHGSGRSYTFDEIHAIDEFLQQLETANLFSEVGE